MSRTFGLAFVSDDDTDDRGTSPDYDMGRRRGSAHEQPLIDDESPTGQRSLARAARAKQSKAAKS
jgi:hypothetical protein